MRAHLLFASIVLASPAIANAQSADSPPPNTRSAPSTPPPPEAVKYDLLTFYKDNYFITGFNNKTETKVQTSAKFDLWPNATQHAVYFAFTAKFLWDLYLPSAPFRESNYNPEIFYTFFHHKSRYQPPHGCSFFHERFGVEHESDGDAGPTSRGWNRVYIESRFDCHAENDLFATASLRVWAPPFGASDNPDITHYLGYGELGISLGSEGGRNRWGDVDLTAIGRKGTSSTLTTGSLELDLRWRPPYADFWRFTPYIFTQLFAGFGETLLTYNEATTSLRVGIGLSDTSTRSQ